MLKQLESKQLQVLIILYRADTTQSNCTGNILVFSLMRLNSKGNTCQVDMTFILSRLASKSG